ncbi:MAG: sugar transferase [Clostridia bacterium]|nr:sugar transferase [Clostridia bacterium]
MYAIFIKRTLDIVLSLFALIVLFPFLALFTLIGAVAMKGNPFYIQKRPGKIDPQTGKERIINLIKFRSMSNAKDENGKLLPNRERLNKYGRFIRALSIDELPSLLNILTGDISIIGPRPLTVKYLDYYLPQERRRHEVSPGLTGLAQCKGRNNLSWEEKFAFDVWYVDNLSFLLDVKILFLTVLKVLKREGIGQGEKQPVSLHIERAHMEIGLQNESEKVLQ